MNVARALFPAFLFLAACALATPAGAVEPHP
jgi:hypothetical protein